MSSKQSTVQSITLSGRSGNDLYHWRRSLSSIRTGIFADPQISLRHADNPRTSLPQTGSIRRSSDAVSGCLHRACSHRRNRQHRRSRRAIAIGGPGAVFWMWISALLGMCTKFAEVTLAVHFRERNAHGDLVGGPMYYIKNGLSKKMALACRFIFHLRRPDRIRHRKCHSGQHDHDCVSIPTAPEFPYHRSGFGLHEQSDPRHPDRGRGWDLSCLEGSSGSEA